MMTAVLCLFLAASVGGTACPLPDPRAGTALDYGSMKGFVVEDGDPLFVRFAPVILVENYAEPINRVGAPAARYDDHGDEEVYVDSSAPTYYLQKVEWSAGAARYTNLIYRVHFERSKSNKFSRDGGKGENTGLLTIVTLNEAGQPMWVNTVGTCGCFHAVVPTTFVPDAAYPEGWDRNELKVYGETLPGQLAYPPNFDDSVRPVVFLRDGSHRVAELGVASLDAVRAKYELIPAAAADIEALRHLKLGGGETSFYYEEGSKKGLVKGAYKRGESLLLGAWIGDSRVGQDRVYAPKEELPRGFYTTINPTDKDESDMWDYKGFLEQNGWRIN